LALAVAAAPASFGCGRQAGEPSAASPERAAVVRFWERLGEATTLRMKGDCAAAERAYEAALALDPRHEDALYYVGQCLRELGRPLDARKAFSRLVETNPASARGHLALGALLASPDPLEPLDLDAAERHFRRAHEINAEETGPMLRLGEVLLMRGRVGEARGWLEAAANTNPKSVEAPFLAGYVLWESGDGLGARSFYEKARRASQAEAPPQGVLGEGDRKGPRGPAAQPLTSPMGRTLFGEDSWPLSQALAPKMDAAYRAVRERRRLLLLRSGA
jgi:tetratricopeptide (TPR) repeat protein